MSTLPTPANGNGNGKVPQVLDVWLQRLCIGGLIATLHISLVGMVGLAFLGKEQPPALAGIAGVALGALANALSFPGGRR